MAVKAQRVDGSEALVGPLGDPSGKPRVTVGTAPTAVLGANEKRTHAYVQADFENTENVFLGLDTPAVLNEGIALSPDAILQIDADWMYRGFITAICASGGQYLHVFEA
jgi:hypothetical protein